MQTPMPTPTTVAVLIAAACLFQSPAMAAESYDNCTGFIDSIPATISTQGTWCLRKDLSTSVSTGAAVTVANNNVTIDCNDFKIGGLGAGAATSAIGISAVDRLNVTVRHCNVRGFLLGAQLSGASGGGHVVEDNRFDGNTYVGIVAEGDGSVVRRNLVLDTGGSTSSGAGVAIGISTNHAVDIIDNLVGGVLPSADGLGNGSAYGIQTVSNPNASINSNRVRGLTTLGAGTSSGIVNMTSGRISLVGNQVVGSAGAGSVGLACSNSTGRAVENVVNGFVAPISGCADDGNVTVP